VRYTVTVEIDAPMSKVIELFDNPDNCPKWRDGFVSAESIRGSLGAEGSLTKLVNRVRGKGTVMTEAVERKSLLKMFRDASLKEMNNFKSFVGVIGMFPNNG
jgi:hypothetical protein